MDFRVTQAAIARVAELIERRHMISPYFRVGVKSGGCMGISQYFDFTSVIDDTDLLFEFDNVRIIIDTKSAVILNNAELDFVDSLMEKRFELKFPENKKHCSCGTSFSR